MDRIIPLVESCKRAPDFERRVALVEAILDRGLYAINCEEKHERSTANG
jgi:hypothetical protein